MIAQNSPQSVDPIIHFRPRRKRAAPETTVLNLAIVPMVDVVFLLLTFFMCTTTLKRPEGLLPAQLPRMGGPASGVALPISPIVIHLTETGPGPADYSIRVENFVDMPATFNELAALLNQIQQNPGFDDRTPVVIKTARDVHWDHVVGCWNAAVRAKCRYVSFGLD